MPASEGHHPLIEIARRSSRSAPPGPGAAQLALFLGHARGGAWGAVAAGLSFILPAFCITLALTWVYTAFGALPAMRGAFYGIGPVLNRVKQATWVRAFMRGVGPAVIGAIAVSLVAILPHAAPDPFALALLVATVIAILRWRVRPLPLMVAGGAVGVARRALRFGDAFLAR